MSGVIGGLFSHNYINIGEPTSDSLSMRIRFSVYFFPRRNASFSRFIRLKKGLPGPDFEDYLSYWDDWFSSLKIADFLDVVTLIYNWMDSQGQGEAVEWLNFARTVFREENVRYRVDQLCGVHFSVDREFEKNTVSAVAILNKPRYASANSHFEAGQKALVTAPPRTREAIRQTFECVEALFKLMFPGEAALGVTEIVKKLKPLIQDRAKSDAERNAAMQIVDSLKTWVIGAHQYRHASGTEEPDNPPIEFAVLHVSMGASFARWLAEIDADLQRLMGI